MSVESHTFQQVLNLSPEHILDLVETVGIATMFNTSLEIAPNSKISVALVMLANANTMLEQCGCGIDIKISNPIWTNPARYKTPTDRT